MNFTLTLLILIVAPQDTDAELEQALATFKQIYFSPRSGDKERASAIIQVARVKHRKTLLAVSIGLKDFKDRVRISAAKELGGFQKYSSAGTRLLNALNDRSNRKRTGVRREILKSLGKLRHRPALPVLVKLFTERDFLVAREAVLACGKIREKSSIPPMIKLLYKAEKEPANMGDPGDPTGSVEGPDIGTPDAQVNAEQQREQRERKRVLQGPVLDTLKGLTKERYNTAREWDRWWKRYGGSFKLDR